jgi:hypothetical protein
MLPAFPTDGWKGFSAPVFPLLLFELRSWDTPRCSLSLFPHPAKLRLSVLKSSFENLFSYLFYDFLAACNGFLLRRSSSAIRLA